MHAKTFSRASAILAAMAAVVLALTSFSAGSRDAHSEPTDPYPTGSPGACSEGTAWVPGTPAFVERTSEWGLAAAGVEGVRLNVADLDSDGWADLVVRRGGTAPDDFSAGGVRRTWVLRNLQGEGFKDVSRSSGFSALRGTYEGNLGRPGEIVASGDVDNDGRVDLYSGLTTVDPDAALDETSEILLNTGGKFRFGPEDDPIRRVGAKDSPAGASFVDFDRDGNLDLWITQHDYVSGNSFYIVQDRLFRGDGTGRFEDVTVGVGLETLAWNDVTAINEGRAHTRAWAAAACDLNGDGTPELLSSSYGRSPNHLWQGAGSPGAVTFVNRSVASGYAYDGDLTWQDNQFARCYCQANPDAEDCAGVPAPQIGCQTQNWNHAQDRQPFRLGGNSAATLCADLNNDGNLDLLTTEIKHWWAGSGADGADVLLNDGAADVVFARPGRETLGMVVPHAGSSWDEGIMSAAVLDFDNDGWPDVYLGGSDYPGNRGLLYHQAAPGVFEEVPVDDFFEHNRSHGVVTADFDRDGDLDMVVGHSRSRCGEPNDCYETQQVRFFENVLGDRGNWFQLELEGAPGTNRSAIGARVTVVAGDLVQTQEVGGGHGHFGAQNDLALHFGLGAVCNAEVTVRWPDAALTEQTFSTASGYRYRVLQGEAPWVVQPVYEKAGARCALGAGKLDSTAAAAAFLLLLALSIAGLTWRRSDV